jgi:hypothetical protein
MTDPEMTMPDLVRLIVDMVRENVICAVAGTAGTFHLSPEQVAAMAPENLDSIRCWPRERCPVHKEETAS